MTLNGINQQVVINKDISFAEANFDVSGNVQISKELKVNEILAKDSTITLGSDVSINNPPNWWCNHMDSTLSVTRATTLASTLEVQDGASLNNTLSVGGATTMDSTLQVDLGTTLSSTLDVANATTLSSLWM